MKRHGILIVALLALTACGDEPRNQQAVRPLEVPSPGEEEARELMREARALLEDGDERDALERIERVLVLTPDDSEAHYLRGLARFELGQYARAVEPLERVLELTPGDVRARARLAESLLMAGRFDEARRVYREWVDDSAGSADAQLGLGRVLYRLGRYRSAVRHLESAAHLKGRSPEIRSDLGLAYSALGEYAEAERRQREAIDADAAYVEAWFRLADAVTAQGPDRYAEALEALGKVARLAPQHFLARVYTYRLRRLVDDGSTTSVEAIATAWQEVLRVFERGRRGHGGLDPSEENLREDVKTEKKLRTAVVAAPGDPDARRRLAVYLHRAGRIEEALAEYDFVLSLRPEDAATHRARGAALGADGQADEAVAALRRALELAPDDASAWTNLGWLALREGRDSDAAEAYERALALRPDDARALAGRGLAWMHGDRVEQGLAEILRAGGG